MELNKALEIVNNGELDMLSDVELGSVRKALGADGKYAKEAAAVDAAIIRFKVEEKLIMANSGNLEKLSKDYKADEETAEALGNINVVDEKGQKVDVAQEVTEAAKLRVEVENAKTPTVMSAEDYNKAVHDEIAKVLGAIITVKHTQNAENQQLENAQKAGEELSGIYSGQQVTVDANSFAAGVSSHVAETAQKNEGLSKRFKNSSFFKGIKKRLSALDGKLENKFGEKYLKAKGIAENLVRQGTMKEAAIGGIVAGAAVATAGTVAAPVASLGAAVYAGWMGYRRLAPVFNRYKEEKKQNKELKFGDFAKANKKEISKAALYGIVAGAGIVAGGLGAVYTATNSGATGLMAAAKTAGTVRTVAMGTVAVAPQAADIVTAKTKEERKKAVKRTVTAGGLFAAVTALGGLMHGNNASAHTPEDPNILNDSDFTNGGDSTLVHPSDSARVDSTFVHPSDSTMVDSTGVDSTDTGATGGHDGADNGAGVDAGEQEITVGAREQAFYTRRLNLVPNSDIMVANVNDGLVELPKGMTPEMAVNLARADELYYGNDKGLQALIDCDQANVDTKAYFRGLADKFVTQAGDPRGMMNYPIDPNYVADPRIHAQVTKIDCEDVKLHRTVSGGHHPVHHAPVHHAPAQQETPHNTPQETVIPPELLEPTIPQEPIEPKIDIDGIGGHIVPDTPAQPVVVPEDHSNMEWGHFRNAAEFDKAVQESGTVLNEGIEVKGTTNGGDHYQHAADMMNKNPDLENAKFDDAGKLVDASGKPVNTKLKGGSIADIIMQLQGGNSK